MLCHTEFIDYVHMGVEGVKYKARREDSGRLNPVVVDVNRTYFYMFAIKSYRFLSF